MEPVRIKYWGLIPMTRQAYVIAQVAVIIMLALLVVIGLLWPREHRPDVWILQHFHWIALIGVVAEVLELFVMLAKYSKKQREVDEAQSQTQPRA